MESWKTLSRRVILDHSKFLVIEEHAVELPDGQVIDDWPWVITPDFINVVAVTHDDLFVCFRQNKYGVEGTSLAPVGGFLEPGEDPLEGARRELLEETGYEAKDWSAMGSYRVDPNRGAGIAHFYLALQAHRVAEPNSDDLEDQELLLLTREEVRNALVSGDFKALAWVSIISLALGPMEG